MDGIGTELAFVIARVSDGRWPGRLHFPRAVACTWGDHVFGEVRDWRIDHEKLRAQAVNPQGWGLDLSGSLFNQPLDARLEDGSVLHIPMAYPDSFNLSSTRDEATGEYRQLTTVGVNAHRWSRWHLANVRPVAWIADVQGDFGGSPMNLNVDVEVRAQNQSSKLPMWGGTSNSGFWVSGRYDYYFVQPRRSKAWRIIIDTHGVDPEGETLFQDLMFLGFLFGRQLGLGVLFGVSESLEVIHSGFIAAHRKTRASTGSLGAPVPTTLPLVSWIPRFYSLLESAFSANPGLMLPIALYVEGMRGVVPSAFLSVFGALLALADSATTERSGKIGALAQRNEWQAALDRLALEAASSGAGASSRTTLDHRMRQATSDPGVAVVSAFESRGLGVRTELLEAVLSADPLRQAIEMHGETEEDRRAHVRKVQLLREAFTELLANIVGYDGPFNAADRKPREPYDIRLLGKLPKDGWSPHLLYRQAKAVLAFSVEDAWGEVFELPDVPGEGLIGDLATFGKTLSLNTKGLVEAVVQPVLTPNPADEPMGYDFKIVAVGSPTLQTLLFSVTDHGDYLVIRNWSDGDRRIASPDDLVRFAREVADSLEVRQRIRSMMFVASRGTRRDQ